MAPSVSDNRPSSRFALVALCLGLVGAGAMLYYHWGLFMPRALEVSAAQKLGGGYAFGNDFYPVWLTSREWLRTGQDPYSAQMTREIQKGLFGRPLDSRIATDPRLDYRTFSYPAFTDLLFWPTAEFPFPVVRVVLVWLLAALTVMSVLLWTWALSWRVSWRWLGVIVLLTLFSYPALEGLYSAQLGLLVAFLLSAALFAMQRQRFLFAGILMALSMIKPQMTLLAVFYLLLWSVHEWRARGRFCIGFCATMILLIGASLAVLPHWIQSWTRTIFAYRHYARPPLLTEVITSPLGPRLAAPATFVLTATLVVIAVVLAWRNRAAAFGSFAFWITLTVLLCIITIAILPGQAIYDHLILLPGILLLVRHRSALRDAGPVPKTLLLIGGIVLFWPWIAAFALIVLRPWLAPVTFNSTAVFSLPIRTAASLPFALLALLAWTMRVSGVRNQESA